ncbi:hypothetical protein [Kitasatospora sp. NPDC050543]|uniref:hypothetical protein n=1 Tax=Kitasatospora sp. NPDC050543 TaxID=3364054 RepID=UPI0037B76F7D
MTPTASQHAPEPHPSVEELADLSEGLVESPRTAQALRTHVTGCPDCRDTLAALTEVQELLGSAPAPAMPEDLAERLDAALAAEAAARATGATRAADTGPSPAPSAPAPSTGGRPAAAARTSPPGRPEAVTGPPARAGRRRRARVLLGTAAALAAFGLGALLLRPAPQHQDALSSSVPATAPASGGSAAAQQPSDAGAQHPAVAGHVYREDTLAAQARQLLAGRAGTPEQPAQNPAQQPTDGRPQLGAGAGSPCAPAGAGALLAIDHGTFDGAPVDVLVYAVPADPDLLSVVLTVPGCPAGPESVLLRSTVPAR